MNGELLEPLDRVSQSIPHIRDLEWVGKWVGLLPLYPPLRQIHEESGMEVMVLPTSL